MTTKHKTENVLPFGIAKARKDAEGKDSLAGEIAARNSMTLIYLEQLSRQEGKAGKIPEGAERALWAENVRNMVKRIKASGFGLQDLYAASTSDEFRDRYEDPQAYSRNLSAMQNAGSSRQIVGYKKYLEFIQLVDALTGEGLPQLVAELTQGITLIEGATAIPEGCFELARQLEIIANRVGRKSGLIEKFKELARIREEHLCSGGDCVWPDDYSSFEEELYTPMPGKKVREVTAFYGEGEPQLLEEKYFDESIGSLRVTDDDGPLLAEGKRSLRARIIEEPAARRLAENAYYIDSQRATYGSASTASNKSLTIYPVGDQLNCLPIHYAGAIFDRDWFGVDGHIKGKYLIRDRAELSGWLEELFSMKPIRKWEGVDSDLNGYEGGFHLAVYLYPNEKNDGLIPVVKLGFEEGTHMAPLNAQYISMLADNVVFPKRRKKEFPYQTESLMSYLKMAVASGELEGDWEKTASLIEHCPLWAVEK